MSEVRVAKIADKTDFYRLWKACFGDSDAFCDWFFENRFLPEYSVVLESEGEIVSCMQAFPYCITIRGKSIPAAMLCGVSTHPEHRKKGYMGKIFTHEMNYLREKGICVAAHTPAFLSSYFSFGHLPVADAGYLKCSVIPSLKKTDHFYIINENEWHKLYPVYQMFSEKYSGIIERTEEDFLRKADDYAADGGKAAAYIVDNSIYAYAFFYQTETEILCVEAVAADGYWKELIGGLFSIGKGLKFSAKLPPEIEISYPNTIMERLQKGVMGLCNVSAFLQKLELQIPYGFRVTDPVVPENNGIFDFCGNAYSGEPIFEISAGHLLQILVGYHDLKELENELIVYDEEKYKKIHEFLPKQKCYIIDEY